MSARRDHTFCPAIRQRDSVDSACERRREVSRMRERCVSRSDWLRGEGVSLVVDEGRSVGSQDAECRA